MTGPAAHAPAVEEYVTKAARFVEHTADGRRRTREGSRLAGQANAARGIIALAFLNRRVRVTTPYATVEGELVSVAVLRQHSYPHVVTVRPADPDSWDATISTANIETIEEIR